MTGGDGTGEDLRAALAVRRELGSDFEPEIIESFLERLDRSIEARVDAQVNAQLAKRPQSGTERRGTAAELAFGSMLGGAIATGAIGATMHADEGPAVLTVWIVVAVINVAHALGGRSRTR